MLNLSKDMVISKEDLEATPQSVFDLIGALLARLGAQAKRIEKTEARLGKNSSNSSKPPSSDSPCRKARHKSENSGGDEKKREKAKPAFAIGKHYALGETMLYLGKACLGIGNKTQAKTLITAALAEFQRLELSNKEQEAKALLRGPSLFRVGKGTHQSYGITTRIYYKK